MCIYIYTYWWMHSRKPNSNFKQDDLRGSHGRKEGPGATMGAPNPMGWLANSMGKMFMKMIQRIMFKLNHDDPMVVWGAPRKFCKSKGSLMFYTSAYTNAVVNPTGRWRGGEGKEKEQGGFLSGWWWLEHGFYDFPYWECHHPNWRTHIFQRGRYTTNQIIINHH